MDLPSYYIPLDRRHALAGHITLPEWTTGAAVFADISGFTPLTEALTMELGQRRGAEELNIHLNQVYEALITELHRHRGSVLSFSGDAITGWIDGDDGRRATAAALTMQEKMTRFSEVRTTSGKVISIGLKVAVVAGPVRRFLVGNPDYRYIDTMAGETMERIAVAEHYAASGDVILDEATAAHLGNLLTISQWRLADEPGTRFAVVTGMNAEVPPTPWPYLPDNAVSEKIKSAWLLPQIYERLRSGLGEFMTELRPAYALFLRFTGIDYDDDPDAPAKLDTFVRKTEEILARFDGSLLQLTIGDKGSYFYVSFGAPVAHEDDGVRVASAALELQAMVASLSFMNPVQIGITGGRMCTGAYGSSNRRTYGVIGDAVNLSARLMSAAEPGQILVNETARTAAGNRFLCERLPDLSVKGKRELVAVWRLIGLNTKDKGGLLEPQYRLPMVGRLVELETVRGLFAAAAQNNGNIIGITGEAGMGKSRFTAESIRLARESGLTVFSGECESYGTTTSYLAWRRLWRSFFDLDSAQTTEEQIAILESRLAALDPSLLPRLPLLGTVLNITIPDNELTQSLDAKVRKSSLEELLTRCLQLRAQQEPLLLILEDCQWLDDLSRDLVINLGKIANNLPLSMLLVYRLLEPQEAEELGVAKYTHFTEIILGEFSNAETQQLIELKLANLWGPENEVTPALVERIASRAAGNPFYIEELLNYLQDLGVDLREPNILETIDLPTSIHTLVLSRIDQLTRSQQLTIKVASVIGRLFPASMVWGVYPELSSESVQQNLSSLGHLDLVQVETPDPELTYLFKHIITQQVAYGSLLYSTRSMLHEQIGHYIERNYADRLDRYLNLLAFHYEHSENEAKKKEYLLKSGDAAQKDYSLNAAVYYFEKSLPLLSDRQLVDTRRQLGKVLELKGAWNEAGAQYEAALALAEQLADQEAVAWCQTDLGGLEIKRNAYETADQWFTSAQKIFESLGHHKGRGQVLHFAGTLAAQQGDYTLAQQRYMNSLVLRRELNDLENEAQVLNNLGIVARYLGNDDAAREYYEAALAIQEKFDNRWTIGALLNNLALLSIDNENYDYATEQLERALVIWQEIGERWGTTNTLHNLANVARDRGDFQASKALYAKSVVEWQALAANWGLAYWLEDMGLFHLKQAAPEKTIQLISAATALRERIGNPRPPAHQTKMDSAVFEATDALGEEGRVAADIRGQALSVDEAIELALNSDL